jgi:hypothetical protein
MGFPFGRPQNILRNEVKLKEFSMKKGLFKGMTLFAALIAVLVSAGCGSAPEARANRPAWVSNPPQDDEKIFGMGSAVSTNESRGWRMAENRARTSISYQITAIVRGMQVDYTRQAGSDGAETGQNFFEEVGRQLTITTLNGARVEQRGVGSNGTYYVLVSYSESSARAAGSAAIQREAENTQIAINKDIAMRAMDAEFDKARTPALVETGGE